MSIDVFLCYRRAGAQTAKLFSYYLQDIQFPGGVWYSDKEVYGNYKMDVPSLIDEAECAVLFVDENFTKGFRDGETPYECITRLEIVEIEKKMQKDPAFRLFVVTLDCDSFTKEAEFDLEHVFKEEGIFTKNSLSHFVHCNVIHFNTAKDDEHSLFKDIVKKACNERLLDKYIAQGDFYFGMERTTANLVVWDQENGIEPERITFQMMLDPIPFYRRVEQIRCQERDVKQDNDMVSLASMEINLTSNEEKKEVVIGYRTIKYRQFLKALDLLRVQGIGIKEKINLYHWETDVYEIPNAMGLAFMVVTGNGKLVFMKRSGMRDIRPNEYDCSIVEGLKPRFEVNDTTNSHKISYDIDDTAYVLKEIHRAYREELSRDDDGLKIKINGIVFDKAYGQWNIVGTIWTPDDDETLSRRFSTREDSYEKMTMEFVPYCDEQGNKTLEPLKKIMPRFVRSGMWSMALAALYGTLCDLGFSNKEIDEIPL